MVQLGQCCAIALRSGTMLKHKDDKSKKVCEGSTASKRRKVDVVEKEFKVYNKQQVTKEDNETSFGDKKMET